MNTAYTLGMRWSYAQLVCKEPGWSIKIIDATTHIYRRKAKRGQKHK